MKKVVFFTSVILISSCFVTSAQSSSDGKLLLKDNWAIQSSSQVKTDGKTISVPGYNTNSWYPASVPTTVLAALVANKVFPDPYFGTNINDLPGAITGRGREMPAGSPYKVPWWYRTEFNLPSDFKGKNTWIKFHSINYKANIWINGKLVADTTTIEGAYRLFNIDITKYVTAGSNNCLALEIFPPKGMDLTITWVDWNPTTPDKGMGIWYDIDLYSTGAIAIENPFVVTKLNLPSTDQAKLTITAELKNTEQKPVSGTFKGTIENIAFSQKVDLGAGETKLISFVPEAFPQLVIKNPRLWWPHTVGPQNLYDLNLSFETTTGTSDTKKVRFGIREVTSWMNKFDKHLTKVFQINGQNIVIRGGGYVQDLLLRPSNERIDADLLYAKHMNLNALRMEAPRGSDYLFERCDEEGILLMVGWCCCGPWEQWKKWTPHTGDIAELSWKDQIVHLRNHPSVFTWLYGSDNFPPAEVENRYLKVLRQFDPTRPSESSATADSSSVTGRSGMYMGPYPEVYAYYPPAYWYSKLEFNTEAGPAGEQIPPMETMRKMMPEKDMWPMSASWDLRLHKAFYPIARKAFESRYGKPTGVEEYSMKSQVFQNEAVKAMFEAFAANKYRSSGIIYWMYNSAWPKMYWQLYDYFLNPNGAFYGAKTACEPLHIQYCYDDNSIKILNSYYKEFKGLKVSTKILDFNMKEVWSNLSDASVGPDGTSKLFNLVIPDNISRVFFLKLVLTDATGKVISSNFYWLSSKGDASADFTDLDKLPKSDVIVTASALQRDGNNYKLSVTIENPGTSLAFAVNPKILRMGSGDPVLPVFWEDNYISLLPKEKRTLLVEFAMKDLNNEKPVLKVDGWNVNEVQKELK